MDEIIKEINTPAKATDAVSSFRANNPDGKSELEYKEISAKVAMQLWHRARSHSNRVTSANISEDHKTLELRNEIPYRLKKIILPALQEKFRLLLTTFDLMEPAESNPKSWYEAFLNNCIEIDDLLEQMALSILSVWTTNDTGQGFLEDNPHVEHVTRLRAEKTEDLVAYMMTACHDFFSGSYQHQRWGRVPSPSQYITAAITRRIPRIIDRIAQIIQWLQKSLLSVSREDWKIAIEECDDLLSLLAQPIRFKADRYYDSDGEPDDSRTITNNTKGNFARAAVHLMIISRIYFNKLSRSTNSQLLIFVGPSMEIGDHQLKLLLEGTEKLNYELIPKYQVRGYTLANSTSRSSG